MAVLTQKGFHYVRSAEQSELLVGYTLVLGSTLNAAELEELHRLEPELKSVEVDPKHYERGTLLIKVIDADTQRAVWRGRREGFAHLEMPEELRKQRLRAVIEDVLAAFPTGAE